MDHTARQVPLRQTSRTDTPQGTAGGRVHADQTTGCRHCAAHLPCVGQRGRFGKRELLYYKEGFPRHVNAGFMVSVCSSLKIKRRDCGTINGHDESSSIWALMKDAREVLVR